MNPTKEAESKQTCSTKIPNGVFDGCDDDDDCAGLNIINDYDDDKEQYDENELNDGDDENELNDTIGINNINERFATKEKESENNGACNDEDTPFDKPTYENVDSINLFQQQQQHRIVMNVFKNNTSQNNISSNTIMGNNDHTIKNFQNATIPLNNYESNTSATGQQPLYNFTSSDSNDTITNYNDANHESDIDNDNNNQTLKMLFRDANQNSIFAWAEKQKQRE